LAIQIQGNGGTVADVDGTTFRAMRITPRPVDHGAFGHYRIAATTGTIAAALAANGQLFYFRWTDATRLAVITWVQWKFKTLTVFTSATLTDFGVDLYKVTAVSAAGGGTTLGAPSKMRTSMGASLVGSITIATTAALTALTTLDAAAIASSLGHPNRRTPATAIEEPLDQVPYGVFNADSGHGEHPLVLAQNEGIVLRNRVVWPAAGTGVLQVEMGWAEVTAY
jgi:hypothetical protein